MKFGSAHYVPALKLKRGEKQALRSLSAAATAAMTPILEIVEIPAPAPGKSQKTIAAHLDTAFEGFEPAVRPFKRYFLDAREIESNGEAGAREAFRRAAQLKTPFTPVTGLSRVSDVLPAIESMKHGLALRLTREELDSDVIPDLLT